MNDAELAGLRERVHAVTRPQPQLLWLYVLTALAGLCAFPLLIVPLAIRYATLWYRFTDEGVAMGHGFFFRREIRLTYARMQDIHLSQSLLERWLGIGTIAVQTAGAGTGGNVTIVGVEDAEAIRDYLYVRMRGVRAEAEPRLQAAGVEAESGEGARGTAAPASRAQGEALLVEIRDALRATALALEAADGRDRRGDA